MLTAGQVASQAQLEESANDRGEAGVGEGPKSGDFDVLNGPGIPLLEVFFLEIAFIIATGRLKTWLTKKKDKQTSSDRIWPIWSSAGDPFSDT